MAIPPPPGHHTLTPAATVRGARAVITFMETAFGGELIETYEAPGGLIAHAEVKVRDCVFMLGDVMEGDPMPAMVSFYVQGRRRGRRDVQGRSGGGRDQRHGAGRSVLRIPFRHRNRLRRQPVDDLRSRRRPDAGADPRAHAGDDGRLIGPARMKPGRLRNLDCTVLSSRPPRPTGFARSPIQGQNRWEYRNDLSAPLA